MAHLVYACRFDIPGPEGFDTVVEAYRDWLTHRYRDKHCIADFKFSIARTGDANGLPGGHSLSSKVYEEDTDKVSRVVWSFLDDNDSGIRWVNDVSVGKFGESCSVEHKISIESVEYNVSPIKLFLGSPRVIRDVCAKTPTYIGKMQVMAMPYDLSQDKLGDFLKLLSSNLRKLPLVLLSPYEQGDPNRIEADRLARNLAGVAVVVRIEHDEVTWDLSREVGKHLSCFNGAARVYWPGFSKDDDPRVHPFFLGARIEQVGPTIAMRSIERKVFAVAAFRFAPDRRVVDLVHKVEAAERQKLINEKSDEVWEAYGRDLEKLDKAREKIQELEEENAALKNNLNVLLAEFPTSDGIEEEPEGDDGLEFSSVAGAVERARGECKNIEILRTVSKPASDSPFQRPEDVYKALCDLNETVDAWRKQRNDKGSGGDIRQHLQNRGWKRVRMHISPTTRGKYRSDYEFPYKGKMQLFEPHITIGAGDANSCVSIHFTLDEDCGKIIVAYVGRHLRNTKT